MEVSNASRSPPHSGQLYVSLMVRSCSEISSRRSSGYGRAGGLSIEALRRSGGCSCRCRTSPRSHQPEPRRQSGRRLPAARRRRLHVRDFPGAVRGSRPLVKARRAIGDRSACTAPFGRGPGLRCDAAQIGRTRDMGRVREDATGSYIPISAGRLSLPREPWDARPRGSSASLHLSHRSRAWLRATAPCGGS